MKQALSTFLLFLFIFPSSAQNKVDVYFQQAFNEQSQMLSGKKPIDFKRAVFLTENAFYKGKLNYQDFCNEISNTAQKLKTLIHERGLEKYKTAGNWAVYTYMMDSIPLNNYHPFTYDFNDFMGDKDYSNMFVTKLLKTRSGNCNSLPTYYKILCAEIGAKASLALAPNHLYIKHINEEGKWTNVELTNNSFPRDAWIMEEMGISVEAVKNGVYMTPLSDKEAIAETMLNLANAYQFLYGYDDFLLKIANTTVSYFPKYVSMYMIKANYYKTIGEAEQKKQNPNLAFMKKTHAQYLQSIQTMNTLGYKDETPEHYAAWVKNIEEEKNRRNISTKN